MDKEEQLNNLLGLNQDNSRRNSARELRDNALEELRQRRERQKVEQEDNFEFNLTPRELYAEISKYVIGQQEALQRICNAFCYHYSNLQDDRRKIKNNVLLIGPTGCGKTYALEKISEITNIPLIISDATKFSGTGYVGDNVQNLVQDLIIKTEGDLNLASKGIIYIDEIDKIAARECYGRDVSGRDVQNGLLKIVEQSDIKVIGREGPAILNTKNILFMGGGAFSDLGNFMKNEQSTQMGFKIKTKEQYGSKDIENLQSCEIIQALKKYGMIPELLGRIPVIAKFEKLRKEELVRILKESEDSPIKAYQQDFKSYGINAKFEEDAYETIAELAYERGIGARGLKSVIEESLTPFKFYLPDMEIEEITFSGQVIKHPQDSLMALLESYKNKCEGGKNDTTE
jgi:endopeptidase Clp ATP-binding regulatory subunit ClpX